MGRLINADEHECWACTHHATGKCDTWCDASESFELRDDVRDAKTAFNMEEVVKELEELRKVTDVPVIHSYCNTTISKAIEIVRKGGVKNE